MLNKISCSFVDVLKNVHTVQVWSQMHLTEPVLGVDGIILIEGIVQGIDSNWHSK